MATANRFERSSKLKRKGMLNATRREDGVANRRRASHARSSSACECVRRVGRGIKFEKESVTRSSVRTR